MRLTSALHMRKWMVRLNHVVKYNNKWHEFRQLKIQESGDREALSSMGIKVYSMDEVVNSTPFLPPFEVPSPESLNPSPIKGPLARDETHPKWHSKVCYDYYDGTLFPMNYNLLTAKKLTKTVEVTEGLLPERVYDALDRIRHKGDVDHEAIKNLILETQLYDATQKKLPRDFVVPYIGWHPVNDRMATKMAYDVTKVSWQRKLNAEYGIPQHRKIKQLTLGLIRQADLYHSPNFPDLILNRSHFEKYILRQYFNRGDDYGRVNLKIPLSYAADEPISPLMSLEKAEATTKSLQLPDLYPMDAFAGVRPIQIYQDENNFPILEDQERFMHTSFCFKDYLGLRDTDYFMGRSLMTCFASAIGQARLLYGEDVSGVLPKPIVVQNIHTDGIRFNFGVFQLNTLDIGNPEGIKNIYWNENEVTELYSRCVMDKALPILENYNPDVFEKILAIHVHK